MSDVGSSGAPGMLPAAMTRFVGRRRELGDVRRLLGEARLVTLTGVGGVGKTRLALEVAEQSRRAFGDGVRFVDLSVLADGGRIAEAVAVALGVADRSTRPTLDKVVDRVRDRHALLVVDNCEHLVGDVAVLIDRLLRSTTALRVLATSRHTLGLHGEHLFAVPPLRLPDLGLPQRAEVTAQFDAVRLLADRAAAIRPGFAVTDANAAAVARLCHRLDGIPLAIELAATRLRTLSVAQVADRLDGRFALLTGGSAAAQPRQQTLRALVDWSHELCSPAERLLWARLSVFSGSFDLAAAEGVCADGELPAADVLDTMDHLVAQSIVLAEDETAGVRFRLLETIRQYGRERLAERGETADLTRRHRDHYLAVAESAAARWCGPHQEADLAGLRADHGNLRAALEASTSPGAPDGAAGQGATPGLRLVAALRHHWYADDFLVEGRHWCDRVLALPGGDERARTRALWVAAWVCLLQGDVRAGEERLAECELLAARTGDDAAAAQVTSLRGTAALFAGRLDDAAELFRAADAAMAAAGDDEGPLWTLFQLGITHVHRGEHAAAVEVCRRALRASDRVGERLCRSYTSWVLGFAAWRTGDPEGATRLLLEGLATQRLFNDALGAALMMETSAWVAASQGETDVAARRLAAARAAWAAAGTTISAFGPPLEGHHAACVERLRAAGVEPEPPVRVVPTLAQAIVDVLAGAAASADRPAARPAPPSAPAPATPAAGTGGLTARELAVAELVAQGMSNKAVAAALVVSPRTVDGHVERILAKLGFTSRTQVAAWMTARSVAAADG